MSGIPIGGAVLSLADGTRVARGDKFELDKPTLDRIKKEAPPKGSKPAVVDVDGAAAAPTAPDADGIAAAWLSDSQARAAVLARLLPILNGSSRVRPGVVELLARLLRQQAPLEQTVPAAPERSALAALATRLAQQRPPPELSTAEQAVVDGGLSAEERAVLLAGEPVAAGVAMLAATDAQELLSAVAAVTALSAEALQAKACNLLFPPLEQLYNVTELCASGVLQLR